MARPKLTKYHDILRNFLVPKLRKTSLMWPMRNEAIAKARVERGLYQCAMCKNTFQRQGVHLDHINPVVPVGRSLKEMSWDEYIPNLYCEASNFQVICTTCHDAKTLIEDIMRQGKQVDRDVKKEKKRSKVSSIKKTV